MTQSTSTFKTFPEFSKLTMADKGKYVALIRDYPPLVDLSFAGLMVWWNFLDSCAVSRLHNNLVISYWLPGDEKNSGLSLIGTDKIDESVCTLFDSLKAHDEPARLVHVPEFTISSMQYPELFTFTAEQDYDECIFAVSGFCPLSHATKRTKTKIQKFLSRVDEDMIEVRSLDLRTKVNRQLLLTGANKWFRKGGFNDLGKLNEEALALAIDAATQLDIENICLFIDGELAGFQLYQAPADKRYVIGTFTKVDTSIPGTPEYMMYVAARHFAEIGATYINYEQDLGVATLRAEKLSLGPVNFFRKYTVRPAT